MSSFTTSNGTTFERAEDGEIVIYDDHPICWRIPKHDVAGLGQWLLNTAAREALENE